MLERAKRAILGLALAGLMAGWLTGCAVMSEDGRFLSRPLTGDNWPENPVLAALAAPVAGVALAADALVVNPVRVFPKAVLKASSLSSLAFKVPVTAAKMALPDPLVYPVSVPLWLAGSAVLWPMTETYYAAMPMDDDD